VITAGAEATSGGTTPTLSDSGSIAGLVVKGNAIAVSGSTTINIARPRQPLHPPGRHGRQPDRGSRLELLVNQAPNILGLAWGTSIRVAVARADIVNIASPQRQEPAAWSAPSRLTDC
jgi:hypothetical protein